MCPCLLTIAFLSFVGCNHAAQMHMSNAAGQPEDWSGRDWLLHMAEEEEHLFPLMIDEFDWLRKELMNQHELFRREIAMFGKIISTNIVALHSRKEDQFIETYLRKHPGLKAALEKAA